MIKPILKAINLVLLFFLISYILDAWLPSKTTTETIRQSRRSEYPGRGGGSGNFYFQVSTQKHSFSSGTELVKGDKIVLRITPIYKIVQSFCTSSGECFEHNDSPYHQPLYTLLVIVLILFILYTLVFEKELRFLKRLTFGNLIATVLFAAYFLLMWVLL